MKYEKFERSEFEKAGVSISRALDIEASIFQNAFKIWIQMEKERDRASFHFPKEENIKGKRQSTTKVTPASLRCKFI